MQVRITGNAKVLGLIDTLGIQQKILGISRKEVKTYLDQVKEIGSYKVTMRPFWRRVIPLSSDEVEVIEK
jgi:hypothetical protein